MEESLEIDGGHPFRRAVHATAELLGKLKIDFAFVGAVAGSAWLGEDPSGQAVDVLGLLGPDRMQQVPMMGANNGFEVDPEAVEAARELDLIPMAWPVATGVTIPIHVLLATNSLYSWMIRDAVDGKIDDVVVKIVSRSDWALLLAVDDRPDTVARLERLAERMTDAELERFNERLASIGLREKVISR